MTDQYEPHCDCLGGHVSMIPDPNGRWCRADEGWQDISTAPKDGTCVILWVIEDHNGNGHMLWPCMMLHDEWCWEISDNRNLDYDYEIIERCEITHWRPLPAPPTPIPTEADHA